MNRKQFIESVGATCINWNWSWSFVNNNDKFVVIGTWDIHTEGGISLVFSESWEYSYSGRKNSGYPQTLDLLLHVERDDYQLKTFPMIFSDEKGNMDGEGPAAIKDIKPILTDCALVRFEDSWFSLANNVEENSTVFERQIKYVRDKRTKAIKHEGISLNKDSAKRVMAEYYKENKSWLPKNIISQREVILKALSMGTPVAKAFEQSVTNLNNTV